MLNKEKQEVVSWEELSDEFSYDPITGLLTRKRKKRGVSHPLGTPLGTLGSDGYLAIRHNYYMYKVHRLVWFIYYKSWPSECLDHIDRVKTHNWISNLREASFAENAHNRSLLISNTSNAPNVTWHVHKNKWMVSVKAHGRKYHGGYFTSFNEAVEAMTLLKRKLHGDFSSI